MTSVFGDAPAAMAQHLRLALGGRTESYAQGVTVGTRTPTARLPHRGPSPLVVVSQDGPGRVSLRSLSKVTLRITAWHATDDDAFDLACLCHALACDIADPVIRSALMVLSPTKAVDPDTSEPLAFCTVTANLAPLTLL